MARCINNEKHGRKIFYGAMIAEGVIGLIWVTLGMSFYSDTAALAAALGPKGNAALVVNNISVELLGVFGGALAVLGVVVLLVLVLSQGRLGSTTIADFSDGAKSAETLQTGDTILQVDGKPCWTIYTLADVFDGTEKTHTMKILRGGEVVTLPAVTVGPTLNEDGSVSYATDFRVAAQKLSVHSVAVVTGEMFRYYSGAILGGFWQLFTGQAGMEELSGPVGTVSAVSQAVRYGWRDVLSMMALLTINVGIFNLLPIPALDGCKLLFLAWEGLTGHPVPDSVQGFVNTAGMVALVWLMVLVTLQDLTRFL